MKKEVGTKTLVVVLALVALMVLWLGWQFVLRPGPEGEIPPLSTRPKPLVPPGTYFPPAGRGGSNMAAPQPADPADDLAQRAKPR